MLGYTFFFFFLFVSAALLPVLNIYIYIYTHIDINDKQLKLISKVSNSSKAREADPSNDERHRT